MLKVIDPETSQRATLTDPESIADEILMERDIRFHEGSFYQFDDETSTWNPSTTDELKRLVLYQLPGGYNLTKVAAILEILRLKSQIKPIKPDRETIIFQNGILNWKTGHFREFTKNDFVVSPLQVNYLPGAPCQRFNQFLDEIFEGDPDKAEKIEMLKQYFGLCLTKDTSFQKALLLIGSGSNGKSVLLNLLETLFGDANISKLELSQLGNAFHIGALQNKYLNISTELAAKDKFSESLFKSIVAGETCFADRKFQDPYQFKPFARLIFATNSLPYTSDTTFAFYRRWLILRFNRTFAPQQQDRDLPEKLIRELPGVINWALNGLRSLHEQNYFTEPASHKETLRFFEFQNNNVAVFCDEMIQREPGASIHFSELYRSYTSFCGEGNYRSKSKLNFKTELLQLIPEARFFTSHGQRKFSNIRLINIEPY